MNKLAERLTAGEIIAFVGAGASSEHALTWTGLIDHMAGVYGEWEEIERPLPLGSRA